MGRAPGVPGLVVGRRTITVSCLTPTLVSTVTPFEIVPILPARFTVTSMGPLEPGAMCHGWAGSLATVQPHDVRTLLMSTSDGETFVSQNLNLASASPPGEVYSLVSASHLRTLGSTGANGLPGAIG